MTESAKRLARLHTLRCRMADAAASERQRIVQEIGAVDKSLLVVRSEIAAQHTRRDDPWCERQALLRVAAGQNQQWMHRREQLQEVHEDSKTQERAAVQAREQIGRMLDGLRAQIAVEQSRREQARMDDLFAMTRVRSAMATAF